MKKETYQNKLDKRPFDNKKVKQDDETHDSKLFEKSIKKAEKHFNIVKNHNPND